MGDQPTFLTFKERKKIEELLKAGLSYKEIAEQLDVAASTITKEVNSTTPDIPRRMLYNAQFAQTVAAMRTRRRNMSLHTEALVSDDASVNVLYASGDLA